MKNILIITHHFLPEINGTATRVGEILKRLLNNKELARAFIIAPQPSRPFGKFKQTFKFLSKDVKDKGKLIVYRIWTFQPPSTDPSFSQRLLNYILFPLVAISSAIALMLVSDIVYIIAPPTPICLFGPLAKIFNRTIIVDITDLWHEEAKELEYINARHSFFEKISKGLELLCIASSDIITTATKTIANYYKSVGSFVKKKFFVLPTPIDKSLVKKYCHLSDSVEERTSRKNFIVYAGNIGKPQSLEIIINTFYLAKQKNEDIIDNLIIIGGGEREEFLRHLIDELSLNNYIKILPPRERKMIFKDFYSKAKIGLIPLAYSKALIYAVPTKLYEYLACGLPYISYGSSLELKYIALDSNAGIHIEKEEPEEILRAIQYIQNKWEEHHLNAKKYYYKFEKTVDSILVTIIRHRK